MSPVAISINNKTTAIIPRVMNKRVVCLRGCFIPDVCNSRLSRIQVRKKGYLCLMVSASPSFYVKPLGELLGFDEVLGTDVLLEERMPAMPKLPNGNNKGAVKVERLRERNVLPEHGVLENAVAYSDSAADLPMLLSCRRKVLVNPSPALKEDRLLDGAECLYPARPWKGRFGKIWRIGFFVMEIGRAHV